HHRGDVSGQDRGDGGRGGGRAGAPAPLYAGTLLGGAAHRSGSAAGGDHAGGGGAEPDGAPGRLPLSPPLPGGHAPLRDRGATAPDDERPTRRLPPVRLGLRAASTRARPSAHGWTRARPSWWRSHHPRAAAPAAAPGRSGRARAWPCPPSFARARRPTARRPRTPLP